MKRLLVLVLLALFVTASVFAERIGTMKIRGVDCMYDTLVFRHIGPGVTYTQFQFNNMDLGSLIPYKMRIHLFTVDLANPYSRMSPYMAHNTYYACSSQDYEVQYQTEQLGLKPFASVNGMSFIQSPPGPTEPSMYMESKDHLVSDGLIRYENNSTRIRYYDDAQNKGHVGCLTMKANVVSSKGITAEIGQINHFRDYVHGKKQLALFCNEIPRSMDTNLNDGVEVVLQGDAIRVGKNQLKVLRRSYGCGSYLLSDQHIITGVGTEMEEFLEGLEIGETITIEVGYTDASGNEVVANNSFTAFIPNCVTEGVPYGDPRSNVAYPATGVSKDGSIVYVADLEISSYSNAPLRCLEDFLINVGAWNAFYHDGGPSSEMTIDGKFVTNNSIGGGFNGRCIPNGVMFYSTAPDDNEVVSVETEDNSARKLNMGETFSLKLFAYNKYGEMIDSKACNNEAVTIDIPDGLGTISSTGVFTAKKRGVGVITVSVKGHGTQLSIPVNIGNKSGLILSPTKVFTGEDRPVQLGVKYFAGTEITDIDPAKVTWSVDDKNVVSSCDNGRIVPFMDGFATVTASYEDATGTATVEVENLEEEGTPYIDLTDNVTSLSAIDLHLPSVPHEIYVETVPKDDTPIVLKYITGDKEHEVTLTNKGAGIANIETITLDYDAPDTYPVMVKSLNPADTELKRLVAIYTGQPSAINDVYPGVNGQYSGIADHFRVTLSGSQLILTNCSSATDVTITADSFTGTRLAELQTHILESGTCTLDVPLTEPLILRVQTTTATQAFKLISITQ